MSEAIARQVIGHLTVCTFGQQTDPIQALRTAREIDSVWRYHVRPPRDHRDDGFQVIHDTYDDSRERGVQTIWADGILLHQPQTVSIASRDCPLVILTDTESKKTAVLHAGRAALTAYGADSQNIIAAGLRAVSDPDGALSVHAYITAGICQTCFEHDREKDQDMLRYFLEHHPRAVSKAGNLDLIHVIKQTLTSSGVRPPNIIHDKLCTRCHPHLASHRRQDTTNNLAVVSSQ